MDHAERRRSRRAELARGRIINAGAHVLLEHGYFRATVEQIADAAGVSPATVYAVAGGKSGILDALMQAWAASPEVTRVEETLAAAATPVEVLDALARASARVRSDHGRTIRIALSTAPHDDGAAASLQVATARYRSALMVVARRLQELDPQHFPNVDTLAEELWFCFGYGAWNALLNDLGHSVDSAQAWLRQRAGVLLSVAEPLDRPTTKS